MAIFDGVEFILDGRRYRWAGGYSDQLYSKEKKCIEKGTMRMIKKRLFYASYVIEVPSWWVLGPSTYSVGWSLLFQNQDKDKRDEIIAALRDELRAMVY